MAKLTPASQIMSHVLCWWPGPTIIYRQQKLKTEEGTRRCQQLQFDMWLQFFSFLPGCARLVLLKSKCGLVMPKPAAARADQLTLFQLGEGRLSPPITTGTPNCFHLPASMIWILLKDFLVSSILPKRNEKMKTIDLTVPQVKLFWFVRIEDAKKSFWN